MGLTPGLLPRRLLYGAWFPVEGPVRQKHLWIPLAAAVVVAVLAVGARLPFWAGKEIEATGTPTIGGPFTLIDHQGRAVTEANFRGSYLLVFFGFTTCPDICPTTLQAVTQALDEIGDSAERVRPILITIDPARDTQRVLADYVGHFHPRLVGLTGTADQVAAAAKVYGVYYAKAPGAGEDYLMDHSSILYLMDAEGRFVRHFAPGAGVAELAAALREVLQ